MAHWYFHLTTPTGTFVDEEGRDASDLASAQPLAVGFARFEISRAIEKGHLDLNSRIDIASEAGQVVSTVHFVECLQISGEFPDRLQDIGS